MGLQANQYGAAAVVALEPAGVLFVPSCIHHCQVGLKVRSLNVINRLELLLLLLHLSTSILSHF